MRSTLDKHKLVEIDILEAQYTFSYRLYLFSPCRSLALGQQYTSLGSQPILCGSIPGLVPKQLRFCRNYIEIMPSVAEGVKLGIQECQHQFRGRRWNCTTIDDSLAIFGPVLDKGIIYSMLGGGGH